MIRKYEIENRIENIIDIFCYTGTPKERCIVWKKALPISFDWNEVVREWYYIRKKDERNRTFNK